MKLLWIKTDFLHPATHGGRIRTLEMLKRLHRRHEIHYVGFAPRGQPEGLQRASEYSTAAYPIPHEPARRFSLRFWGQFAAAAATRFPFSAYGHRSAAMRSAVRRLIRTEGFDRVICDFPYPAVNIDRIEDCVLFQHNVETMIWRRQAQHAPNPLRRAFFQRQAAFTERFEREVCRRAERVIAVSADDAGAMQRMFAIPKPAWVPTGVDRDYFRPAAAEPKWDFVFLGSMDWLPNVDAVEFFVREVLPHIRRRRPGATAVIAGRNPSAPVLALAADDPAVTVTGSVPDIRPFLWASKMCVVPLRMGGGTRLKIYEAMAAELPVVSTTIGAEGLETNPPHDIRIADAPEDFARHCIELLESATARQAVAQAGATLVRERFTWDRSAEAFEQAAGLTEPRA